MYRTLFLILFFASCKDPAKKFESRIEKRSDTASMQSSDTNTASSNVLNTDTFENAIQLPVIQKPKSPNGIYQTVLPLNNKIEQTIAFNDDLTYQLQEKYINKEKDSVIITEGTWTPSDGYIWLYKDQIAIGRYKWKGDTLQYYSAALKKKFSMKRLPDAAQNKAWHDKNREGIVVFAVGTEPFWSIELNNRDSLLFSLPEWGHPLRMKVDSSFSNSDSTGYFSKTDSVQIRVTVFPHFCSDGMSNFTYRNKVRVQYNQQVYNGCGIVYRQ
jgi:uncharacterized membrane protein